MRAGLTPNAVQWCRCGGLRGPNLAECVAVRRRFRAKVGVFWQSLSMLFYDTALLGQNGFRFFFNEYISIDWVPTSRIE